MAKSFFDSPLNLDPKAGDMTDIIFKSAQMSLEKRERQRQAIQGVVDTFMTVAKLNQEKTRMEMQDRVAKAGLEFQRNAHEDKMDLGWDGLDAKQNKPGKPTSFRDPNTGKITDTYGPELGTVKNNPRDQVQNSIDKINAAAIIDINTVEAQVQALAKRYAGVTSESGLGNQLQAHWDAVWQSFVKDEGSSDIVALNSESSLFETFYAKSLGKEVGALTDQERKAARKLVFHSTDTKRMRALKEASVSRIAGIARAVRKLGPVSGDLVSATVAEEVDRVLKEIDMEKTFGGATTPKVPASGGSLKLQIQEELNRRSKK